MMSLKKDGRNNLQNDIVYGLIYFLKDPKKCTCLASISKTLLARPREASVFISIGK